MKSLIIVLAFIGFAFAGPNCKSACSKAKVAEVKICCEVCKENKCCLDAEKCCQVEGKCPKACAKCPEKSECTKKTACTKDEKSCDKAKDAKTCATAKSHCKK